MNKSRGKIKLLWLSLLAIIVLIVVPIVINRLLYLPIETNNTTDGDWLGFWGSYIGSIIGCIATLIGIIYTMKTFFYDKNPILIPLKKEFYIYINNEREVELSPSFRMENEVISSKPFEFDVINVGRGAALDVKIIWIPPKQIKTGYEERDKFIDDNNKSILNRFTNKKEEFQVIRSDDGANIEKIDIFIGLENLIKLIIKSHVSDDIVILGALNFVFDVSLGYMEITYNDIYYTDTKMKKVRYEMFLKTKGITYKKYIQSQISFKRIKSIY